jgi:hypothetical protein
VRSPRLYRQRSPKRERNAVLVCLAATVAAIMLSSSDVASEVEYGRRVHVGGGRFSTSGSLSTLRVRVPADSQRPGCLLAAPVHHLAPASSKSRSRLFPVSHKELKYILWA